MRKLKVAKQLASRASTRTLVTNERGGDGAFGMVEKGLNALGRVWHQRMAYFDFSKHAEVSTKYDLDHISAGNDSSMSTEGNALTHDKWCKWWTVEGLPGAGKDQFGQEFATRGDLKYMGTSHLLWELERLKEVKGYEGMYNTWKMMVEDGTHFLAQRSVSMDGFYQAPNDDVHSSRMQDHMKLQRHIHAMDALRHLLTTAQGTVSNRTHHSDYCYAFAMMKMGYMPKQFYEMRYTVSQAAADGSNTATDLTPNVSFLLDITPEESFESIKARGNEAEIATCNLDFLKYLDEAYKTFWSEDMHNKGCSVFTQPRNYNMDDIIDFINISDEDELRHPYSRWSYAGERQTGNANRSQMFGPNQAILDWAVSGHYNRFNKSKHAFAPLIRPTAMAGNFYEKVVQCDLSRGPTYSYDILYSFQPWDEVAESYSQMESHCYQTGRPQWDFFSNGPREDMPFRHHPDWRPKSHDIFNHGHADMASILFGSTTKYMGEEQNQNKTRYQRQL